jgi:hypothetical protein
MAGEMLDFLSELRGRAPSEWPLAKSLRGERTSSNEVGGHENGLPKI